MNGRAGRKKKNGVAIQGEWFAMPLEFLRSRACAELSPHAVKVLLDLCAQLGRNSARNGDLSAPPDYMRTRGWASTATRVAALRELLDANLIVVTRSADRRRCALFGLTLWPLSCDFSKLDVAPGCCTPSTWTKGESERSEKPTLEAPAVWNRPRKNAISVPATGITDRVIVPPRESPTVRKPSYRPAAGITANPQPAPADSRHGTPSLDLHLQAPERGPQAQLPHVQMQVQKVANGATPGAWSEVGRTPSSKATRGSVRWARSCEKCGAAFEITTPVSATPHNAKSKAFAAVRCQACKLTRAEVVQRMRAGRAAWADKKARPPGAPNGKR